MCAHRYTTITNPTQPCDHSVYNKTCTVFAGSLLIDISPALDAGSGNWLKQQNPDVQVTTQWPLAHQHCV